MAKRIILCGASSVGKTTIATEWCKRHKEYHHIQEVARDVMKEHNINRDHMTDSLKSDPKKEVFLKLQQLILEAQNRHEKGIPSNQSYISDRGPDPIVFTYVYVNREAAQKLAESNEGRQCIERYKKCLVAMLCPLKTPTDDNFRLVQDEEEQQRFVDAMFDIFHKYNIPYIYINEVNHTKRMCILRKAVYDGILPIHHNSMLTAVGVYPICVMFCVQIKPPLPDVLAVRTLEITTSTIECKYYRYDPKEKDRMVNRYGAKNFIRLEFHRCVEPSDARRVLQYGVHVDGEEYQFIGCSQGGIKYRHCYMYKGSIKDVESALKECGNFDDIKSTSKRLKRIGLLFSKAIPTKVKVPKEDTIFIDDIKTSKGNFTDGCGSVGIKLANAIVEGAKLDLNGGLPSVYQIRFDGCKGVVSIDPTKPQTSLLIRKSMEKFKSGTKPLDSIWLCNYSRPHSYGKLNRQFIMLLSGLGIDDDVFLHKQQEYYKMIELMTTSKEVAIKMLLWDNEPDKARELEKCSDFNSCGYLFDNICKLQRRHIEKMSKLSIFVEDSRYVFGVCDQCSILEYGQCFIRPTIRGKPHTITGNIVIAKSPCYLLGDIRVLKAIDVPELNHLIDCIVFPIKGKRPHPNEIAGSDLDGDEYFVSWDPLLIPHKIYEPYHYPAVETHNTFTTTRDLMINYLSKQNKQSLVMGKIDVNFRYFAELKGVNCPECKELGMYFSRSIDSIKTGDTVKIPGHLRQPANSMNNVSVQDQVPVALAEHQEYTASIQQTVWMKMKEIADKTKKNLTGSILDDKKINASTVSEAFICEILQNSSGHSEFKLFEFAQQWCYSQYSDEKEATSKLVELSRHINFGKMKIDERMKAVDAGIPEELVSNALNWSSLLTQDMLSNFSMQLSQCGWHFYLSSHSNNFSWHHLMHALHKYNESLLAIGLGDGVTSVIHFKCAVPLGKSEVIPGSIVAYFFSSRFDYKEVYELGENYNLNLDDGYLQLYRNNNIAQTFIWLRNEIEVKKENEILLNRMSIDLQRYPSAKKNHPKINKHTFHCIEVYVKSTNNSPAYFDFYYPDQSPEWTPEVIMFDELDVLPEFEEGELENVGKGSDDFTDHVQYLKCISNTGNCQCFLEALQMILPLTEFSLTKYNTVLLACLRTLISECVTKYVHTCWKLADVEAFQIILTQLQEIITDPLEFLNLASSASCLKCPKILQQVVALLLPKVELKSVSAFISTCSSWQLWYFIPLEPAMSILQHLFTLCQSLVSSQAQQSPQLTKYALVQLAANCKVQVSIKVSPALFQKYSSHFAYLTLCHTLHEMTTKQESTVIKDHDTGYNLIKMRACNVHSSTEDDSDKVNPEGDRENKYKRVGFHRSQEISSQSFAKYTWVTVNLMIKTRDGKTVSVPVAVGVIVHITKIPAYVIVDISYPVPVCLIQSLKTSRGHWELGQISNIIAFKRAMKCLYSISRGQVSNVVSLLVLVHQTVIHPENEQHNIDTEMTEVSLHKIENFRSCSPQTFNASQQRAIDAALTQRVTLIHGPPGTGKTVLACEIVRLICDRLCSKECILVTAETNMAVDNLTRKLLELNIKVVRIGRLDAISPDIQQVVLELMSSDGEKTRSVLSTAKVIATTCTGADDPALKGMSFPYVLIDEATQVTEPNSLIPLINGCKQLILIGDPEQLSPTLLVATPGNDHPNSPQVHQLSETLFHRLQKSLPSFFLNEQYRMHPRIAAFPSEVFYNNKLKSAKCTHLRSPVNSPIFNEQVMFIDTQSTETHCGRSYRNEKECEVVTKVIQQLLMDKVTSNNIAVLTPYAAQVKHIRESLFATNGVEVCTIDSFQGRENDIIIFSTVRCNAQGTLGFVDDKYRMNVLLTRAKSSVIGVGSMKMLSCSLLWKTWLQQVAKVINMNELTILLQDNTKKHQKPSQRDYSQNHRRQEAQKGNHRKNDGDRGYIQHKSSGGGRKQYSKKHFQNHK
ncbi:uncharacterized protein [Dysidea avara]|uniref:uncharacterized protein n=1 Tax=Dysidea avara TaxID=196820 RepID=UPI00332229D0